MMLRCTSFILLTCASVNVCGQSLFPGISSDRRSRTYDVHHYRIVVGFDETERRVDGTTSITFSPLVADLDSLVLDAENMNVFAASFPSGEGLRFSNRSPQLVVFFDASLRLSDTATVVIRYSCNPKAGLYFVQPDSADPKARRQIWSQGEDTDNHFWFPCYDSPNDKATSEMIATVPESYRLLSNGRLLTSVHDERNKTMTFHWFESKPHSSYLIMVAAGEYDVVREQCGAVPLEYYVYKDRAGDGVRSLAKTAAAMKFFEQKIGVPYPWEKYAQIWISNFMWGGMENASAVTLNDESYLLDPRAAIDFTSDDVVAHELAHQWWGDLVTSRDWNNLWLHEGFANYFEALFKQNQKGEDYFQHDLMQQASSVITTEDTHGRSALVGKDGYTGNVYSKGCWVLHMLRNLLGEEEFWAAIRFYAQRYAFRNVDSHEFMLAVEDATGRNLGWFFEQWVYRPGYPKIRVNSTWNEGTRTLLLDLTQVQAMDTLTGLFRFPLSIECITSEGSVTSTAFIDKQTQRITMKLPARPLMMTLDKGKSILATFERDITKEEHVYRLLHAGDIVDRIDAAKKLQAYVNDESVFVSLQHACLHDRYWAVRNEAALSLAMSEHPGVKETLMRVYSDHHSSVRSTAIAELKRFSTGDVADFVWAAAVKDSSYLVLSAALKTLAGLDSTRGFALAARNVDAESYRNMIRRASLNVFRILKNEKALPFALKYSEVGSPQDIRLQSVRLLGEIGRNNPDARLRLFALLNNALGSIRKAAIESIATWGDNEAKNAITQRRLIEQDDIVNKSIERALATSADDPASPSLQGK